MSMSDPFGAGLGGPGMWDPMPLTPPVKPPSEADQGQLIWSRPEPEAAPAPAARAPAPKKAAAPKAAPKPRATGRPVKKAAAGRPVKKAAGKIAARKRKTVTKKAAKRR